MDERALWADVGLTGLMAGLAKADEDEPKARDTVGGLAAEAERVVVCVVEAEERLTGLDGLAFALGLGLERPPLP